jgi:hypothetical protein
MLDDIAILTGAEVITEELGSSSSTTELTPRGEDARLTDELLPRPRGRLGLQRRHRVNGRRDR